MRMADRMYDLDNQFEQLKKKNTELEKENAELKHTIAELRRDKDILNMHTKAQEKLAEYRGEQFTKAKEIIRDLLGCFFYLFQHNDETRGHIKINNAIEQAEQFLKEIEK